MTSEREPFLEQSEPFLQFTADENKSNVQKSFQNVTESAKASSNRVKVNMLVPSSLCFRLDRIVIAERRRTNIVMEKILSDFIEAQTSEPRPYIPTEIRTEEMRKCQWQLDSELVSMIKARALVEGRNYKTLFVRAILDYIIASPDDPVKTDSRFAEESE